MLLLRSSLLRTVHRTCGRNIIKQESTKATSANARETEQQPQDSSLDPSKRSGAGLKSTKPAGKLKARQPLAKNFFMGVVDKELLGYPEVIAREDMAKLQNDLLPLKNYFEDEVDSHAIATTQQIPPAVLENIRDLGLYGINVPRDFDGKGWGWSESLMASEPESNSVDVALGLLSHRTVVDVLNECGTEDQQQRFLSKLGSGSLVATEAIFEYTAPEDDFFNTTATYSPESQTWTLNGTKSFVVTGPLAAGASQLFLVIAQTNRLNVQSDARRGTTIFLVDSNMPGVIKLGDKHITVGCRGVEMRHVQFDQVQVPASCVVGQAHEGNYVADALLRSNRLRNSMIGLKMAKNVLNELVEHCVNSKQCGVVLKDMEMTQIHLAESTCDTYAMESMIYLTAGLLDEFDEQDVALEAAITKYFTLKQLFKMATKCMDIIGPKSLHSGQSTEVAFRNALQLYTQGESLDTLRIFITLTGLQHAGALLNTTVRMSRNPLFHPMHMFGKFLNTSTIDHPKTKMRLAENVHPSLEPAAQCIEHSVARLQMCVELLLTRYGNEIVERHSEMHRLAEMATTIYAMFASVSRSSRSYCIGLPLADHEMLIASSIALNGRDVVKTLCAEVFAGKFVNNDNNLQRLSNQVVKSKGYFPVHPLTFNF